MEDHVIQGIDAPEPAAHAVNTSGATSDGHAHEGPTAQTPGTPGVCLLSCVCCCSIPSVCTVLARVFFPYGIIQTALANFLRKRAIIGDGTAQLCVTCRYDMERHSCFDVRLIQSISAV